MQIKWNKKLVGLTVLIGVITAVAVAGAITFMSLNNLENNHSHSHAPQTNILKQEDVKKNFESNGKWASKTSLVAADFEGYDEIANNAFSDPTLKLDSVELPYDISLSSDAAALSWSGVKLITTNRTKIEADIGLFISNNIVYYSEANGKNKFELNALTISDETKAMANLNVGTIGGEINSVFTNANTTISIAEDFYNPIIFQNINSIELNNSDHYDITYINENAFRDCKKLSSVRIANNNEDLFISLNAFYQASLTNADISLANGLFSIGSFAFKNCNQLTDIKINAPMQMYESEAFSIETPINQRNISMTSPDLDPSKSICFLSDNLFSGTYNSLNIKLIFNSDSVILTKNVFSEIKLTNPKKLLITCPFTYDILFKDAGLPFDFGVANVVTIPSSTPPKGINHG